MHFSVHIEIADGSKLSYRVVGDLSKPTIIFVNGSIFNYTQFDPVLYPALRAILGDAYSYVFYDYVGIGDSSELINGFDFNVITRQHIEFLDALGIESAHHFGYSKGSIITQLVASSAGSRVLSIGSLGSPNLSYPTEGENHEFQERVDNLKKLQYLWEQKISEENYNILYRDVFQPMAFPHGMHFYDFLKNWWVKKSIKPMLLGTKIGNIYELYQLYATSSYSQDDIDAYVQGLQQITVPTLLFHGEIDETVPLAGAQQLAEIIPHARLIVYPKVMHTTPALLKSHGRAIMRDYADFLQNI